MVKITEVSGVIRYVNAFSIESYLPEENEVVMADGRILVIDPKESDVDALMSSGGDSSADLYYLKQFIVNVSCIATGKSPAILIQEGVSNCVRSITDKAWNDLTCLIENKDEKE